MIQRRPNPHHTAQTVRGGAIRNTPSVTCRKGRRGGKRMRKKGGGNEKEEGEGRGGGEEEEAAV